MSPDFFNLYGENILRLLEELDDGVLINVSGINNIRYADDTVLMVDNEEGLQRLMDFVVDASSYEGLEINSKKTYCMVISKDSQPLKCNLTSNGTVIEQLDSFSYLRSIITSDGRCEKEIKRCIGMAKTSFNQMSIILKDHKLSMSLKTRVLKCFVWSVLLYGSESWTLSSPTTKNIEATEIWFYRRMLHISYAAHETSDSVLQRVGQECQLLKIIQARQVSFTNHVIRKGKLEELCLAWKVPGKKPRGKPKLLFLNQLKKIIGLGTPLAIWDTTKNQELKVK